MKKFVKIALVFTVLLFCCVTVANAATNQQVIDYLSKSFNVNGKSVSLTAAEKVKVERYLNEHPVSGEKADEIIAKVDESVALMRKENVTDPRKLSDASKASFKAAVQAAGSAAGVSITFNSDSKTMEVYGSDGKLVDKISTETTASLVQTGSDNAVVVYTLAGVAVIAIAGFVVYNRKKANA